LNLARIHVEAFEYTVLLWLTKEFFYQTLLLTATGVTEPVGHYRMCRGIKTYPTNVIFQLNSLTKHVTEVNHLKLYQAI